MRGGLIAWAAVIGPLTLCVLGLDPARSSAQSTTSSGAGLGFIHPLQADIDWSQVPVGPTNQLGCPHTHVFFINGIDPLNLGNLYGLTEFVCAHGFPNTHFGQMCHGPKCYRKVKEVRACDPCARIVLIGYSGGAYVARRVANDLGRDGVCVDLLVYVGGDMLCNTPYSQPDNARRILNICGHGLILSGGNLFWHGTDLDCAFNVRLPVRHFLLPSRRETIQVLMNELGTVAATPVQTHH